MAALITVIVGSAAWYAGRQSAAFGTSHVIADLQQTQKDTAAVRLELEKTKTENSALQKSLDSLKGGTIANDEAKLQARATGLEAELSQYKADMHLTVPAAGTVKVGSIFCVGSPGSPSGLRQANTAVERASDVAIANWPSGLTVAFVSL